MRKYVLHNNQRIYFTESDVQTEVLCVECSAEIPLESVYCLRGQISAHNMLTIHLDGPSGDLPIHAGCITLYISKQVAGMRQKTSREVPATA